MSKRLTDNEIKIRIVPTHLRWPEASTTVVWRRLHECVDQLHRFVRAVDNSCAEVERKTDLSSSGIAQQRTEISDQALVELANFRPLHVAEHAAAKEIDLLEKRASPLILTRLR